MRVDFLMLVSHHVTPSEKAGDLEVLDCSQQLKLLQLMFVIEKKCGATRF